MKKIFILLLIILVGSCTVQKRLHSRGYHVEWRKKFNSNNTDLTIKPSDQIYPEESKLSENDSLNNDVPTEIAIQNEELDSSIPKNTFNEPNTRIIKSLPILKKKIQVDFIKKQTLTNAKENNQEPEKKPKSPSLSFLLALIFLTLIFFSPAILTLFGAENILFILLYLFFLTILTIVFLIRTISLSIQQKRDYFLMVLSVLILIVLLAVLIAILLFTFSF